MNKLGKVRGKYFIFIFEAAAHKKMQLFKANQIKYILDFILHVKDSMLLEW